MSDDDRDIDIDSDDDDSDSRQRQAINTQGFSQAEKRAHHNALERKRRDHIKDSFSNLRETVPALQGEKVASRAQILKKAADHIQQMRRKNFSHQKDINDLTRQNRLLESQIRTLEKAKLNGNFPVDPCEIKSELPETDDYHSESSDSDDDARTVRVTKKMKIATTMH